MHYAILGCVHGNRAALLAVLRDIEERAIERVICLGDVVGFGPQPLECIDLARERCYMTIRGDHDLALVEGPDGFIPKTARVLEWTREQLEATPDPALTQARRAYLQGMRDSFSNSGLAFHHGSTRSCHEYLFPSDVRRDPRKLRGSLEAVDKVCFHAHTHVPGVIVGEPLTWRSAAELEGRYHYRKGKKAMVNVGSVGQPRDGDPRACYLEIKKNEMFWRRVEYDVSTVVSELQANDDVFASDLAIRLQKGR